MHELDDNALLREYAEQNSEAAFATLVTRHVDKVYSAALRHTRNAHAAEEITQAVFVILARKAKTLRQHAVLSGWLYETARLTALTYIRSEIRRTHREQEAHMQTALNENTENAWPHIAPLLDDALAGLSAADRHAVVLRYFDGKSLGEVGAALGASEDAAKKRVTRAVEKLRSWFTKRGVTLTATVLTAAISAYSVQAAPLGLAATITATAVKGAAVSGSTLTLIKGALKIMAWTKVKTVMVMSIGLVLATSLTVITTKRLNRHANVPVQVVAVSYTNSVQTNHRMFAILTLKNHEAAPIEWRDNWTEIEGDSTRRATIINPYLAWFSGRELLPAQAIQIAAGKPNDPGRWRVCVEYSLQGDTNVLVTKSGWQN